MKMVIVQITEAEGKQIPTGKLISQGAHAAVTAAVIAKDSYPLGYKLWMEGGQTKIVCRADSPEKLEAIFMAGKVAGIPTSKIIDKGKTVFAGPTLTAVAIGPAPAEMINKITGQLPLL